MKFWIIASCAFSCLVASAQWKGTLKSWKGFDAYHFKQEGLRAYVIVPKKVAKGAPWLWAARFQGYNPEVQIELLKKGYHIAHINTGGMLGSDRAMKHWDSFYNYLTQQGLSKKPTLRGVSRGGLFIYHWAAKNPNKVSAILGDAPVCSIMSWPLGSGKGLGDQQIVSKMMKEYQFSSPADFKQYKRNPIDILEPIAKAKIPIIHVISPNDKIVPASENTDILAKRYRDLGGNIEVIVAPPSKRFNGHHYKNPDVARTLKFIMDSTK